MNDRELLELAAKATGEYFMSDIPANVPVIFTLYGKPWNPLEDDGDALRLAVKLCMTVTAMSAFCGAKPNFGGKGFDEPCISSDRNAAMRLAIVKAAAEIGKSLPPHNQPPPSHHTSCRPTSAERHTHVRSREDRLWSR